MQMLAPMRCFFCAACRSTGTRIILQILIRSLTGEDSKPPSAPRQNEPAEVTVRAWLAEYVCGPEDVFIAEGFLREIVRLLHVSHV